MKEIVYVFLGGGLGSVFRYLLVLLFAHGEASRTVFPWATFTANISGCFLIGLFHAISYKFNVSPETRLFLTVGICGGFTTFSTLSNETFLMLKSELYGILSLYLAVSLALGLAAVWAGNAIGKLM